MIAYFGHGGDGFLSINYANPPGEWIVAGNSKEATSHGVSKLNNSNVLSTAKIYLFACHSGTANKEGQSIAHDLSNHFGVWTFGARGGVSFSRNTGLPIIRNRYKDDDIEKGDSGWQWYGKE